MVKGFTTIVAAYYEEWVIFYEFEDVFVDITVVGVELGD